MLGARSAAVFLDRDGTIIEEVGYLNSPEQVLLLPRAAQAIRRLNERGVPVVVVTNQSGVARGLFTEESVLAVHAAVRTLLSAQGAWIDAFYFCPHHPDGTIPGYSRHCACRKPLPGMLESAANDFGLSLASSVVIGDKQLDVDTARSAGARGVLVLTGHGKLELARLESAGSARPDHVADDLLGAVEWFLGLTPEG
jgi:D-glycero-D-manno-heptose 1,7-bisphosphate phosphatase